jgi:hypothetical protein
MEVLTGYVVAAGTTPTPLTMASGNSLVVRNAPPGTDIRLLQAWVDSQGDGFLRIRGPEFHDNVQGLRLGHQTSVVHPLLPDGVFQRLYPQQVIVAELTGSATSGDIDTACLLLWYKELPGVSARLIDVAELVRRIKNILATENTIAAGTSGGYSGEETVISEMNTFKANTDYALIGYLVRTYECAVVRWRGVDTGNLGVGGPGCEDLKELTRRWFIWLSEKYGIPTIPVFNSANFNATYIDVAQDENGNDPVVTSIWAELG